MIREHLFDEFDSVSARQWKQKIQFDLKGADYNKTLLTETPEGITINPFYHEDTFRKLKIPSVPDTFRIVQNIFISSELKSRERALNAINRGAETIQFSANKKFDFSLLFDKELKKSNIPFSFRFSFLDPDFINDLLQHLDGCRVYLNIDLISNLATTGNWFESNQADHHSLKKIWNNAAENTGILSVDASVYLEAGGTIVQQLAYALAHANEYFAFIDASGLSEKQKEHLLKNMIFHFGIGNHYFFEIAKLRAFRYLIDQLLQAYGWNFPVKIAAVPGLRNKTLFDPYVNMLRTTSESLSAVMGGADMIGNLSYDAFFKKHNEFSDRIARNQLLILKEESGLNSARFTEGTFFIEDITYQMVVKARELFDEIEKTGGFVKTLFKGTIQRKLKESARKEQQLFEKGEKILVGTNKYPNKNEQLSKEDFEIYPFVKRRPVKTLIEPVVPQRLSEKVEKEKLGFK